MRILAAVALVALVQSQSTEPVHASQQLACVFDTAAFRDTVEVWFSLELHRDAGDRKRRETLPYAMAIAGAYQQPARVSFMTWPGTYGEDQENDDDERTPGGFGLDGMIRFVIDREGKVTGQPRVIHDSPQISAALEEAIARARFPEPARDEYPVELLIRSRRNPREGVVSFARIPLPIIRLEEEPRLVQPGPQRYPDNEKQTGTGGRVAVYYVITAKGRMLPGSMYAYEATSVDFARATEEMLLSSFFSPGRSGGCALAVGVQQYVNFVIG